MGQISIRRHKFSRSAFAPCGTPDHRRAADRRGLRYPSDLTDGGTSYVISRQATHRAAARRRSVCHHHCRGRGRGAGTSSRPGWGCGFGSELRCDLLPPSAMVLEIFMKPFFNQG